MYLSKLTGLSMDRVINWYLLLIIFVFDPLAISLVVIANQAFTRTRQTKIETTTPVETTSDTVSTVDIDNDHDDIDVHIAQWYESYDAKRKDNETIEQIDDKKSEEKSTTQSVPEEKKQRPSRVAYWNSK